MYTTGVSTPIKCYLTIHVKCNYLAWMYIVLIADIFVYSPSTFNTLMLYGTVKRFDLAVRYKGEVV